VSPSFPVPLDQYPALPEGSAFIDVLAARVHAEPFNALGTGIFLLAILHTFAAKRFTVMAHRAQEAHDAGEQAEGRPPSPSFQAEMLHFLGEVEVVFGLWVIPLLAAIAGFHGWDTAKGYLGATVHFTEPLFVFVIMALAASRPVLALAEGTLARVAALGGSTPAAWWLTLLTLAPLLGSFITEPAAMTIAALLLGRQFYACGPRPALGYATLGLLFVNVSVGGTLTHFAAPPVLMVARPWGWDMAHMLRNFGWEAATGIAVASGLTYLVFWRQLRGLRLPAPEAAASAVGEAPVPAAVIAVNVGFMAWTVLNAHYPPLFLGGFLLFLGFARATAPHQGAIDLKPPVLVGFFLAGLVIHGGLQGWWIAPVLASLGDTALFFGAAFLTSFNDNALITYLATLVPDLSAAAKHAVVAGAVAGGGLTVIANAPNPAGQSILSRYFEDGISPLGLFLGALGPTIIVSAAMLLLW
jgi:hypothetical protein